MSNTAHPFTGARVPRAGPWPVLCATVWAAAVSCSASDRSSAAVEIQAAARFRHEVRDTVAGGDSRGRLLTRGVVGAEFRAASGIRAFSELASGDVSADRRTAGPNFRNELSLQQLWLEVPVHPAPHRVVARLGRQEFDEGPRQLISVSDGPNLHRTWNGARLTWRDGRMKLGAFAFRATQLGRHGFDEKISVTEQLGGVTAEFVIPHPAGAWNLETFWLRTEKPGAARDTLGARVSGRSGRLILDWTGAVQSERRGNLDIEAWAIFASQSVEISATGWRPRVGLRIDAASGEGEERGHPGGRFDQLYASSSYLGEGLFLSASNLLLVTPGLSFTPTARSRIAVDYGFARRLDEHDAAYAGQLRAYPRTAAVRGHAIGGLLRVMLQWSATPRTVVGLDYEHLSKGDVLARAGLRSRTYAHGSVTFRY